MFFLRSRSARTFITASREVRSFLHHILKPPPIDRHRRQSVFATTEALRGSSSMSANSPTMEPGPAVSRRTDPSRISTSPSMTTYIVSPGSPAWKINFPAAKPVVSLSRNRLRNRFVRGHMLFLSSLTGISFLPSWLWGASAPSGRRQRISGFDGLQRGLALFHDYWEAEGYSRDPKRSVAHRPGTRQKGREAPAPWRDHHSFCGEESM